MQTTNNAIDLQLIKTECESRIDLFSVSSELRSLRESQTSREQENILL